MIRIAIISPILAPEDDYRSKYRLRDCTGIPAEFEFSYIKKGPRFILNAYDDALAAPALLRKVLEYEKRGFDAVVINCSADTALRAYREAVRIPVIGPTESTMLYAMQLVEQFCVLTFTKKINNRFHRIARELGIEERLCEVSSVEIDFSEISNGEERVVNALYREIQELYERTGCDGYILGCTDFEDLAPQLNEKLRENGMDVVIFKPFEISAYQAYMTVAMGLRQGTDSYPRSQIQI